jgi:hypothetical protein
MSRFRVAVLLAALLATPALGQGIPETLRGAWFAGECRDPGGVLLLTARSAARLDAGVPGRLFRFRELRPLAGWTLGTADGADAPRLLLRAADAGLETAEPDAKTRDDRLPGEAPRTAWRRCDPTPAALAAQHGEGFAFMAALEHIEAACGAGTVAGCADALVAQGDVSGDRLLSSAELARMARGAAWLAALQEGSTPDVVGVAVGGGSLAGILSARLLIESLDYDGDGRLSAAELGQDRAAFAAARGNPAGSPLRTDGLAEGAGLLRGLFEGFFGDGGR